MSYGLNGIDLVCALFFLLSPPISYYARIFLPPSPYSSLPLVPLVALSSQNPWRQPLRPIEDQTSLAFTPSLSLFLSLSRSLSGRCLCASVSLVWVWVWHGDFHAQQQTEYGTEWQVGDVVTVLFDVDQGSMSYRLNGIDLVCFSLSLVCSIPLSSPPASFGLPTHTHICTHTRAHTHTLTHSHSHSHAHTRIHKANHTTTPSLLHLTSTRTHAHRQTDTHILTQARTHTHTHTHTQGVAFVDVDTSKAWYPAMSLATGQQCTFNFGASPFVYVSPYSPHKSPPPPPPFTLLFF